MDQDFREERRKVIYEKIEEFRLLDDDFMTKVFENNVEATELLLRIILSRSDLKVQSVQTQYVVKNLQGRSIRMDIRAEDDAGKKYNIEVQRQDKGAGVKRARYNSSLIDANELLSGEDPKYLPETYVIFITENDVMGKGLPCYHVERTIQETGELFHDDAHILYVNAKFRDDSEFGQLMSDFSCVDPDQMHFDILADRVKYFKKTKEGLSIMCKVVEDLCNESRNEGRAEGENRLAKLISLLLENGLTDLIGIVSKDEKEREKQYQRFGIN